MASYVQQVNPYNGIICVPYYYLWIPIVLTWFTSWMELICLIFVKKCKVHILSKKENMEIQINLKMLNGIKSKLKTFQITPNQFLPPEIISIIMTMLPEKDANYKKIISSKTYQIELQSKSTLSIIYIYPVTRFICNIINLVLIFIRYADWWSDHKDDSDWRKYCAFIIALFYMPICKGRGFMRLSSVQWLIDNDEPTWWVIILAGALTLDFGYGTFIFFVAFAIGFPGLFIFIPNTIVLTCVLFCIVGGLFGCIEYCTKKEDLALGIGLKIGLTFVTICAFTTIIMSTMEFFHSGEWVESFLMGMDGSYCNFDDYFTLNKWNEYDWDIKFLVVCWILF